MEAYRATKQWRDGFGAGETRIVAADLVRIEAGISAATQGVTNLEARVQALPGEVISRLQGQIQGLRRDLERAIPVGTISMFGADVDPEGWIRCDGRSLQRSEYPKLFERIGTRFGSSDASNFKVPDYRERTPVGSSGTPKYNLGDTGGRESVTLSIAQIPAHTHPIGEIADAARRFEARTASQDIGIGANGYTYLTSVGTTEGQRTPIAAATGGGSPIDIRTPYLGTVFVIKAK